MNERSEFNDIESRLKTAMAARADDVEPKDEHAALDRIAHRVSVNRRRSFTILGVAAALAVAVGGVALLNRGDDKKQHVNVASGSTNSTSTSASSTAASVVAADPTAIWPFASSNQKFSTPEEAAKTFAVDYLGMTLARVSPAFEDIVDVFPNATGTARTAVHVRQQSNGDWVVLSANADDIVVDTPKPNDPLASSITVSGKSVAFEATVGIQLRRFGSTTPVFSDHTNGGSTDVQPFSTTIAPPATDQPLVLVVFEGDASGRGAMTKATVIPLAAAGSPEPTQFVGWTNGNLTLLDFAGHVQRTLASSASPVESFPAYSPALGLVAYSDRDFGTGNLCGRRIDFVALSGSAPAPILGGGNPAFDSSGATIAFLNCNGGVDISATDGSKRSTVYTGDPIQSITWLGDTAVVLETGDGRLLLKNIGLPNDPPATELRAGTEPASRGRFGTIAFFDGTNISSYNPATGATVKLVQPAAAPQSLDADESGRFLLWVDVNHEMWKWSGTDPVKVGSNFSSAAW